MKIGLFSDTYLPTTNGISFVLQIMQTRLEELGHEVYIFAPATNLRGEEAGDNERIIRFPALEGVFFDEQLTSVFFPPRAMKKIRALELDIIHFFTPAQIGLMGAAAAIREDIPLVGQYSTDLYQYVERYPNVLPGTIALSLIAPFVLKLTPREIMKMMGAFKPKRTVTAWHKGMVARMHMMLHDDCDGVIALSSKMQKQLDGWGSKTPSTLLPTGVDTLPVASAAQVSAFNETHGIHKNDTVILYVGRLSREKNLDLLVEAFALLHKTHKNTTLLLVGDFDYREELEKKVEELGISEKVVFPGRIARNTLSVAYQAADIFAFPSITDTQGLVVNEAAHAGLPLVLCDGEVSEVFVEGVTGIAVASNATSFADSLSRLLDDDALRKQLGKQAKIRAKEFSELGQMQKLEKLYEKWIAQHKRITIGGIEW